MITVDASSIMAPIITLREYTAQRFRRVLLDQVGLSASQYRILSMLELRKEPVPLTELQTVLGISQATVSLETDKLHFNGYIDRKSPEGSRRTAATLTKVGRTKLAQADDALVETYHNIYGVLSPELAMVNKQGTIIGGFPTGLARIRNNEYFTEQIFLELTLSSELLSKKTAQKLGLSLLELRILLEFMTTSRALSPHELSYNLLAHRPRIAEAINRLNGKNLIVKTPQKLDRRYSRITLTEEGLNTAQLGETELRKACFTAISRNLNSKEFNLTVDIAKTCIEDIHRQNPGCF